jgi:hypothetical protein
MFDLIKIRGFYYELHVTLRMNKESLMIKLKRTKDSPLTVSEASGATGTTNALFFKRSKSLKRLDDGG